MDKFKYVFFILAVTGLGFYMGARSGGLNANDRVPANSVTGQEAVLNNMSLQQKSGNKFLSITGREGESLCQVFRDAYSFEVTLTADGVSLPHSGDLQIKSTVSCDSTSFKPVFPGSFCSSSLVQIKNTLIEGVSFDFLNVLDFFPKDWYLSRVVVNTPDGQLEKKPSADEMALNLFSFSCEDFK